MTARDRHPRKNLQSIIPDSKLFFKKKATMMARDRHPRSLRQPWTSWPDISTLTLAPLFFSTTMCAALRTFCFASTPHPSQLSRKVIQGKPHRPQLLAYSRWFPPRHAWVQFLSFSLFMVRCRPEGLKERHLPMRWISRNDIIFLPSLPVCRRVGRSWRIPIQSIWGRRTRAQRLTCTYVLVNEPMSYDRRSFLAWIGRWRE